MSQNPPGVQTTQPLNTKLIQGYADIAGSAYMQAGMNSWSQAMTLDDSMYSISMNTVCRGGKVRTRPGTAIIANFDGTNAQGGKFFTPAGGTASYIVAIDGFIYVANAPFRHFTRLNNIQFSPTSRFVTMTICSQTTDYDNAGNLYFLETPIPIVIFQDGATRAAYWDGNNNGHIDPTPSGSEVTVPGKDGTRIGLWSCWSNNRLWVSRGTQVFASDIGNPLKFTETQYLSEGRGFYLLSDCTGIIETPDKSGIICFSANEGILILSSIQDRTQWVNTAGFQKIILPTGGCVAPRSLINQYGLTWWFGATGLQNLDSALNQNITSKLAYQDMAMSLSKQNIGSDMSGIATGFHENYLMISVPSGDIYNRHTWVLDQNPFEGSSNVWASYWTGWRPVEWSRAVVGGQEQVFFLSKDYDGAIRVWQAFIDENTDNGCAITCMLQTKQHNFGDLYRKKWRYARTFLSQIWGDVSFRWFAVPQNGSPFEIGSKEIAATSGQVYDDKSYGGTLAASNNLFMGQPPADQGFYTPEVDQGGGSKASGCTSCGVQKDSTDNLDYAFGLLMVWSGDMGIDGYQIHIGRDPEHLSGKCEDDEVGPLSINYNGCGAKGYFPVGTLFGKPYASTATVCVNEVESDSDSGSNAHESSGSGSEGRVCSTQTKTSIISQADADRKAECAANFDAQFRAGIYL